MFSRLFYTLLVVGCSTYSPTPETHHNRLKRAMQDCRILHSVLHCLRYLALYCLASRSMIAHPHYAAHLCPFPRYILYLARLGRFLCYIRLSFFDMTSIICPIRASYVCDFTSSLPFSAIAFLSSLYFKKCSIFTSRSSKE